MRNIQIIVLGVCIGVATVVSSLILAEGFMQVMKFTREVINVTGSAQQDIRSDLALWNCAFSRRGTDLAGPYKALKDDLAKVKAYLAAKSVAEKEMEIPQVYTQTLYKKDKDGNDTNEIEGYSLRQHVRVRSQDVDRVARLSRESTELIDQGLEFDSSAPDYFYTKLDELKVEILSRATENARQRAQNMAHATGNRIGMMRSARMGVFQITPLDSTEVRDYGVNDTSSLEKKVTAVVSVSFAIR